MIKMGYLKMFVADCPRPPCLKEDMPTIDQLLETSKSHMEVLDREDVQLHLGRDMAEKQRGKQKKKSTTFLRP